MNKRDAYISVALKFINETRMRDEVIMGCYGVDDWIEEDEQFEKFGEILYEEKLYDVETDITSVKVPNTLARHHHPIYLNISKESKIIEGLDEKEN